MHNLSTVIRFGLPYLRKYWARLACGILLGLIFGLSNTIILGATKTLLDRMFPKPAVASASEQNHEGWKAKAQATLAPVRDKISSFVDPWLPRSSRPVDARQVLGALVFFPLLFAFRGYAGYLTGYCMGWVSERVVNDLRQDVFHKLGTLSLDFYNRSTMGNLITHVDGDTQALQKALNFGVSDLAKEPITIVCTVAFLLWLDWELTLFVVGFLPLCILPMTILGKKMRRASRSNTQAAVSQQSVLVEFLSSIRLIKAYNLEEQATNRFGAHARRILQQRMKQIQAKELISPLMEVLGAFGLGIVIIYILIRHKTGSDLAVFVAAVAALNPPIRKVAGLHLFFEQAVAGIERLMAIFREEPTVKEPTVPRRIKPFAREIRFENVTFAYRDRPVLQNFNLALPYGMKLGVAGESGSGKSTLINLLYRFYDPQEGRILIDGQDIREARTAELRAHMALVSQEIILFDQTIAENIGCGKPGATRTEVEAAAQAAFAHDFILQLPAGYDTRVGDRGVLLSGGQRQRIAIARAFIRQAPILALDEATAALDAEAEAQVQKAIDHLSEYRTVISVAHRLSTLAKMDKVIVLRSGAIVEEGTFAELIRSQRSFGAMARTQGIFSDAHAHLAH
ncbi:MAG TPA: ABC transporter ATP-binding protein [Verrucomicrobiae bacterium]|nr:ABC transporter ATP-binding protein [Verrucomicrobiae bacterium]